LIKAEKANNKKVEFAYDYMGRRTEKRAYASVNNAWNLLSVEKYVYNGWNLIATYDGNNALQKSYLWGIDLRGSLQGAGGVGGLLAENSNSTSYYPVYDGNGNVRVYVDNTGTSVAEYDYGPFGNITVQSGSKADDFAFRFSTKPLDREINSYNFGIRIYRVDIMRWLNEDPLGEKGGANLYCFVKNNPMSKYDVLGMWGEDVHVYFTLNIAGNLRYSNESRTMIAMTDIGVDNDDIGGLGTGWLPSPLGDPSYHFNTNLGGVDSRFVKFDMHLSLAKKICNKKYLSIGESVPPGEAGKIAAMNVGMGLHALQDITAHGDYPAYNVYEAGKIGMNAWHNYGSPQTEFGAPQYYPDNINLDAENSSDGVPRKGVLMKHGDVTYTAYVTGTKRRGKVINDTTYALSGFRDFLRSRECSCECKQYFGFMKGQ
jgi:RHS repeat-associated protein